MAKIALIVGSVRRDRQGIKVARWMEEKLKNRNHTVFFIDPIELKLPLLDRMYKEMDNPSEQMKGFSLVYSSHPINYNKDGLGSIYL